MAKKEKAPKEPKKKKEKKPKEPKPKKEKKPKKAKPPKEKKPKKAKPPKAKKPKKGKAAAEGAEGEGGKKGGKKLLTIVIPIILAAGIAGAAFFFLRGRASRTEDGEPAETVEPIDAETPEEPEEPPETEEPEEPAPAEEPAESGGTELKVEPTMTVAEVADFIRALSPAALGLEGDDMSAFEIYPSEHIVLVDGRPCTEISVYSKGGSAGTNDLEGRYFLTRGSGSGRRLYRLDGATRKVTELPLPAASRAVPDASEPEEPEQTPS